MEPQANKPEHEIIMSKRQTLSITGVRQVESFDNEEFLLETVQGFLSIKGKNLQMVNLDVDKGEVSLKGKIDDLLYIDEPGPQEAKGLFSKLFR
ncbi:sporulation protein YabP [Jeotgalibacillus proteolyticus]|uniref:Sporulation protein YabP n=1 Tax=Jeotgalibacillus proteolyticus TaxID=2082395 RepID=A0A2S5G6G3_9BACL|nr:sporulation protein YabP [Jeotgalibacillus proteolyticus]PPA68569.1 sporulation protein YabP [Jeotgalibacillus proteolyticus]